MIDIIKIATFLETKLNENTSGFFFRVYTFEKTLDRRYEKDEQGQRYDITPAIITTPIGSYLPQNQMRGMRLSFNLEAMIPLKKKDQWIEMINSFVWSVNGKVFYLLDNGTLTETLPSENYQTLKMSMQVPSFGTVGPSNIEVVKQINSYIPIRTTEDYIAINIPISMNTIKDFFIGDERKVWIALVTSAPDMWVTSGESTWNTVPESERYETTTNLNEADFVAQLNASTFDYPLAAVKAYSSILSRYIYAANYGAPGFQTLEEIVCNDFSIKRSKLPLSEHFVGESSAQTLITQNKTTYIFTAYYGKSTVLDRIVEEQVTGLEQNRLYWLKFELPSSSGKKQYAIKVTLSEDSSLFPIGDYCIIPLAFTRAW